MYYWYVYALTFQNPRDINYSKLFLSDLRKRWKPTVPLLVSAIAWPASTRNNARPSNYHPRTSQSLERCTREQPFPLRNLAPNMLVYFLVAHVPKHIFEYTSADAPVVRPAINQKNASAGRRSWRPILVPPSRHRKKARGRYVRDARSDRTYIMNVTWQNHNTHQTNTRIQTNTTSD